MNWDFFFKVCFASIIVGIGSGFYGLSGGQAVGVWLWGYGFVLLLRASNAD